MCARRSPNIIKFKQSKPEMGGGGRDTPLCFTAEKEEEESSVVNHELSQLSPSPSLRSFSLLREEVRDDAEDGTVDGECGSVFELFEKVDPRVRLTNLEFEAYQKKRSIAYRDVLQSYDQLQDASMSLVEAKSKILSYTPGGWIERASGMKLDDYDVPNTTTLLLVGPKGSGKSSLVNRISKVFEDEKFASARAQVSYNSSGGDGTFFLHEYMIPRGSTSFCLYDTRSLSNDSIDNIEMLKNWITKGVRHGQLIIRPSDSSGLKTRMMCKARGNVSQSKDTSEIDFVIFVLNGLEVLNSMDSDADEATEHMQMIATIFNCPYLSFKDDKPVVVVTHGDLLSLADRARIRVYLGEQLGIPPVKQIFDIPESCNPVTELTIINMLQYCLEHADKNLPRKSWLTEKVREVRRARLSAGLSLFIILAVAIISIYLCAHVRPAHKTHNYVDWHAIRHLWLDEN